MIAAFAARSRPRCGLSCVFASLAAMEERPPRGRSGGVLLRRPDTEAHGRRASPARPYLVRSWRSHGPGEPAERLSILPAQDLCPRLGIRRRRQGGVLSLGCACRGAVLEAGRSGRAGRGPISRRRRERTTELCGRATRKVSEFNLYPRNGATRRGRGHRRRCWDRRGQFRAARPRWRGETVLLNDEFAADRRLPDAGRHASPSCATGTEEAVLKAAGVGRLSSRVVRRRCGGCSPPSGRGRGAAWGLWTVIDLLERCRRPWRAKGRGWCSRVVRV